MDNIHQVSLFGGTPLVLIHLTDDTTREYPFSASATTRGVSPLYGYDPPGVVTRGGSNCAMYRNSVIWFVHFLYSFQNGFGSAIQNTDGASGHAVLATFPADNCVLRPHLCPRGFTITFYTKLKPITVSAFMFVFLCNCFVNTSRFSP